MVTLVLGWLAVEGRIIKWVRVRVFYIFFLFKVRFGWFGGKRYMNIGIWVYVGKFFIYIIRVFRVLCLFRCKIFW